MNVISVINRDIVNKRENISFCLHELYLSKWKVYAILKKLTVDLIKCVKIKSRFHENILSSYYKSKKMHIKFK